MQKYYLRRENKAKHNELPDLHTTQTRASEVNASVVTERVFISYPQQNIKG